VAEAVLMTTDLHEADSRVARAQAGDTEAFESLYREYVGRVHGLCRRMAGGDPMRAEDLTQEAFVRAWERLETFREGSAFGPWLMRVAVNVVISDRRSWRRHRSKEDGVEDLEAFESSRPPAPEGAAVDLEKAVATLPDRARQLFVLHDVEGYRHEEIAQMTGLAVGTSKSQLHRARMLLREALAS
jgi:RNA polymerase sigma factor (sigma-70 family)